MELILDLFGGYGIEYDAKEKIIIINQEMPVKTFMQLRHLLKRTNKEVRDIQLYSTRLMRIRRAA